jgi:hypothetical protein
VDLYFYTRRLDLAATNLADLQSLITALADETNETNALTISRVTSKVQPFVQSDTGEPLRLFFYDDGSTVASWVTDPAVALSIGIGYLDPQSADTFASTSATSISGSARVATLPLNTAALANSLNAPQLGRLGLPTPFYLHVRKTEAGATESVVLMRVQITPGVLPATVVADDPGDPGVTSSEFLGAAVLNKSAITSLTGGGAAALDGLGTAAGATVRHPVGCVVLLSYGLITQFWKLVAGTDAEDTAATPAVVRPDDYNATTNAVVWKQIG